MSKDRELLLDADCLVCEGPLAVNPCMHSFVGKKQVVMSRNAYAYLQSYNPNSDLQPQAGSTSPKGTTSMAKNGTTPTRTDVLTKSLESLQQTRTALKSIDLRATKGDVREAVRGARTATDSAVASIRDALKSDVKS